MIACQSRRLLPLPLLVALAAGFALPSQPGPLPASKTGVSPRYGGVFRIKGYARPFNHIFDPAAPSHYFITEQLYDGLVKFDGHLNPTPALAEYWTISEDRTLITFHLRKGVLFHNGRELTADDVKYSLERLVRDRPGNTTYPYFAGKVVGLEEFRNGKAGDVAGFRVVDPLTFEIHWVRPYVSGLYLLGMYYCKILPRDLLESQGRNFFNRPVGTGPFRFSEWIRGRQFEILGVHLQRNAAYYDRAPFLDALEYSPYFTDDQFSEGTVHLIPVTSDKILGADIPVIETSTLKTYYLSFSCDLGPLDRPEVRRALALGLDKTRLAAACDTPDRLHQVTDNYIPPMLPGFFPRTAAPFSDPATARVLLDRLLPEATRKTLTLTLLCDSPRTDESSGFARELGRELGALGVRLEVRYLRRPEDARAMNVPFLRFLPYTMNFPDPENIVLPLYYSGSTGNALSARYDSPRLDALLEQSVSETSWERRTGLFRDMEKILFEDVPAVPLFTERIRIAIRPQVRGLQIPAMGFIFLDVKDIWLGD
jgi:ABC-type transport system substrate-binding protein